MPIDSHCHIHFRAYRDDRDEVIQRTKNKGWKMITVGTNYKTSKDGVELAKKHPGLIFATAGLHPVHLFSTYVDEMEDEPGQTGGGFKSREEDFDSQKYIELAKDDNVVAIGETGLDYFHITNAENREKEIDKQKRVFLQELHAAAQARKPLVLHCRDAYKDMADLLKNEGKADLEAIMVVQVQKQAKKGRFGGTQGLAGTLHCFTGTWEDLEPFIKLGFCVGFTGVITFPPRKSNPEAQKKLFEALRMVPKDRLLVETDSPYLAPMPHRGQRTEPWMCEYVINKMAEVRGEEPVELLRLTEENAKRLFNI